MQPWNAVWLEWQPDRLAGLGQPGATTPVRPSPGETPETLPQGDAKGKPDMMEGRGPRDNGSDLPVPKAPEGREGFIPTNLQVAPSEGTLVMPSHPETGVWSGWLPLTPKEV